MFKLKPMKNKLIIYDHQRLYSDCMFFLLEHSDIFKKYQMVEITDFDDLESYPAHRKFFRSE